MFKTFWRSAAMLVSLLLVLTAFMPTATAGSLGAGIVQAPDQADEAGPSIKAGFPIPALDKHEQARLVQNLKDAPEIHLQFENAGDSPVSISEARARAAESAIPAGISTQAITRFMMDADIVVFNGSNGPIRNLLFQVNSPDWRTLFYLRGANDMVISSHDKQTYRFRHMLLSQDPSNMVVRLIGATSGSGAVWGQLPGPGRPALSPVGRDVKFLRLKSATPEPADISPASPPAASPVDSKPVPLIRPQPRYTLAARTHRVCGEVRMRIQIDHEGNVTGVRLFSFLPDLLSEEAIRVAFAMKFKPAIKGGAAVAYSLSLDIAFNIQ